jgi:acyl-CoA thioester hydrolase
MLSHTATIDVRFYELDPYSHVNHTNYLAYCEVARVAALDSVGIGLTTLEEQGFHIVVTDLTAKFRISAVGGDRLEVTTEVQAIGRASSQWQQHIVRDDEVLFDLAIRAAFTDVGGKPVRVPDFVREALGG